MISAVVITLNESINIESCVLTLLKLTDDVLVLDTGSTDDTIEIAKKAGAQVFETEWKGYGPTKNVAVEYAKHDWVLSIDADEILTDELIQEIKDLTLDVNKVYAINIITYYCGTWIRHSGWFPSYKKRLYNRKQVNWDSREVHENLILGKNQSVQYLKNLIRHYSYRTANDHIRKARLYALKGAQELINRNKSPSWIKRSFGPAFRFFRMYLLRLGILDGKAGFYLALREARMVRWRYNFYNELKKNAV